MLAGTEAVRVRVGGAPAPLGGRSRSSRSHEDVLQGLGMMQTRADALDIRLVIGFLQSRELFEIIHLFAKRMLQNFINGHLVDVPLKRDFTMVLIGCVLHAPSRDTVSNQ